LLALLALGVPDDCTGCAICEIARHGRVNWRTRESQRVRACPLRAHCIHATLRRRDSPSSRSRGTDL